MPGERLGQQRCLHQRCQAMHPSAHVCHTRSQPHLRVGGQSDHARWAKQSSTAPSARVSTTPRIRIVAPTKVISMQESEEGGTRTVGADAVLTGSSAAAEMPPLAGFAPGPYCAIHRRSKLALIPCARAVLATDTPGRRHSCTTARFAASL